MKQIDRNLAPKGYHAIAAPTDQRFDCCIGCAFEKGTRCGLDRKCTSGERPDKQSVIFIANEKTEDLR